MMAPERQDYYRRYEHHPNQSSDNNNNSIRQNGNNIMTNSSNMEYDDDSDDHDIRRDEPDGNNHTDSPNSVHSHGIAYSAAARHHLQAMPPLQRFNWVEPQSNDVCFRSSNAGREQWRLAVQKYSANRTAFPSWNATVFQNILDDLKESGIRRFLVNLDSDGIWPSQRIRDGKWYLATNEEILEKTRQRFRDDRKRGSHASTGEPRRPPGRTTAVNANSSPTSATTQQQQHQHDNHQLNQPPSLSILAQYQQYVTVLCDNRSSLQGELMSNPPINALEALLDLQSKLSQLQHFVSDHIDIQLVAEQIIDHNSSDFDDQATVDAAMAMTWEGDALPGYHPPPPSYDNLSRSIPCVNPKPAPGPRTTFIPDVATSLDSAPSSSFHRRAAPPAEDAILSPVHQAAKDDPSLKSGPNNTNDDMIHPEVVQSAASPPPSPPTPLQGQITTKATTTFGATSTSEIDHANNASTIGGDPKTPRRSIKKVPSNDETKGNNNQTNTIENSRQKWTDSSETTVGEELRLPPEPHADEKTQDLPNIRTEDDTTTAANRPTIACASIPDQGEAHASSSETPMLFLLVAAIESAECSYKQISQLLGIPKWAEFFASLNAEEFSCIIANIPEDSDRPRVAELMARHIHGFSCEYAAKAIPLTSFRVSMASRLHPFCADAATHLGTIENELDDQDMNLLTTLLSSQLQLA